MDEGGVKKKIYLNPPFLLCLIWYSKSFFFFFFSPDSSLRSPDSRSKFKVGDEVWYSGSLASTHGTMAQFSLVDERIVSHKPKSLAFDAAAALPLVTLTAMEALEEIVGVETDPKANADKSILVIGGAGGVGSAVVQVAKHVYGFGKVIASASREATIE